MALHPPSVIQTMNASSKLSLCRARRNGGSLRLRAWALGVALVVAFAWPRGAAAQGGGARLLVLEHTEGAVPESLRRRVDDTLRAQMQSRSTLPIESSPTPFDEVAIAAGCSDASSDECTRKVASTLDTTWLLVRRLRAQSSGGAQLTLILHVPDAAQPTKVGQSVSDEGERTPENVVPALVASLYGDPPKAAAEPPPALAPAPEAAAAAAVSEDSASDEPVSAPSSYKGLRIFGWGATAVGCGLLIAGSTLGAMSKSDHDEYAGAVFGAPEDVNRGLELLNRAQRRARTANGLLAAGAVGAAAGLTALVYALVRTSNREDEPVALNVWPERGGATVAIGGSFWRGP
jgi:hypothetical protein